MNSLTKMFKVAGAAAAVWCFMVISPFFASSPKSGYPFLFFVHDSLARADQTQLNPFQPDPYQGDLIRSPGAESLQDPKLATLASAAVMLLKKKPVWKKIKTIQKKIAHQYSFEYAKTFADKKPGDRSPGGVKKSEGNESGSIRFSGGIGHDLSPGLRLISRFSAADIELHFDALDHELDCSISSRPINKMINARTSIGLSSDGSESRATLQIVFDF